MERFPAPTPRSRTLLVDLKAFFFRSLVGSVQIRGAYGMFELESSKPFYCDFRHSKLESKVSGKFRRKRLSTKMNVFDAEKQY